MSAVKKLKQIILNECENYEEEEILDYNSFVDKFYDDYFFEGIITIYNVIMILEKFILTM